MKKIFPLIIILIIMIFSMACRRSNEPVPTLASTAAPPVIEATATPQIPATNTPPPSSGTGEDIWEQIQAAGVLRVGTSGDYPPFESYNEDLQLEGLDIAIINEIGDRLDLEVEVSDFAFEGLLDALQIGQIDVAIAAIAVTPERLGAVSFSNVYFLSEDAVLAREDSGTEIQTIKDLGGYRVGVQAGTVFEEWIETELIEPGILSQENLLVYAETNEMIADLEEGFVDLLVIDKLPAEAAETSGPFVIVASGLNRQLFAIAVPKGSGELLVNVNQALQGLRNDGTLLDLIQEYTGLSEENIPEFPPIDEIEPIPPVEVECIDGMGYVADLSLDDSSLTDIQEIPPSTPFQKGWRIQNTGTCTWNTNYRLVYVAGNVPAARMGGQPTAIAIDVPPGDEYDLWVDLVSPSYPGTYVGYWQMIDDGGVPFGQRIWVAVTVPATATPTPVPTQTPSPNIQFSTSPEVIQQGQCSTLAWQTDNVKEVYVYPQGQAWQKYGVPGNGDQVVCPATTTTYEMRVVKLDNNVEIRQATVYVQPVTGAPTITRFTAEPAQILESQCVTVQWIVEGQVNRVRISRNNNVLRDPAPLSGSLVDCPPVGAQTYLLEASGPGGTSSAADYVTVVESVTPAPTATPTVPAPKPPVIEYFNAKPKKLEVNQCTTLSWGVGGGASSVQIKRNDIGVIQDNAPFEGTLVNCPTAAGTFTYSVVARNNSGDTVDAEQNVSVSESTPDNPLLGTNWALTSIGQGLIPPGMSITLAFTSESQINGSGGCNSYSADYQLNGNEISISQLVSTSISCGQEIDEQESFYFAALQGATSYQLSNGQLTINSSTSDPLRYAGG